ncbi:MAG TPA: hypothetical protein VMD27_13900 [Candidatus Aquilonibacter sp.]|nr:hypothetical protein [Candidatus Aquilonibacter sp.]
MEPLIDKLARQKMVRKFFETIRNCDKRSDNWVLSLSPEWRIPASVGLLTVAACLALSTLFFGWITIWTMIMVLFCIGYIFLLPNLCLILFVKQNWPFRLVNFGIFLAYLFPVLALFFDWESFLEYFGFAIIIVGLAVGCFVTRERPFRPALVAVAIVASVVVTFVLFVALSIRHTETFAQAVGGSLFYLPSICIFSVPAAVSCLLAQSCRSACLRSA